MNLKGVAESFGTLDYEGEGIARAVNSTPAYTFVTTVAEAGDIYLVLVCRNGFDAGLSHTILDGVRNAIQREDLSRTRLRLVALESSDCRFDRIGIVAPEGHSYLRSISKDIHARTLEIFVCHRFELFGKEKFGEYHTVRRRYVSFIDWEREIFPAVYISLGRSDTTKDDRSYGRAKISQVWGALDNLADEERLYIKNRLGAVIEVSKLDCGIKIGDRFVGQDDLRSEVLRFLESDKE